MFKQTLADVKTEEYITNNVTKAINLKYFILRVYEKQFCLVSLSGA